VRPDTPALNYINLISVLLLWTLIDRRKTKVPYDDDIRFCHFGSLLLTVREWFDGDFAELVYICCFVRSISKECKLKGVFNDKSG
jgi:hypothetical protein